MQRPVCKGAAIAGSLLELEESSCTGASGIGAGADDGRRGLATSEEHLLTGHLGAVVCLAMYQDHLLFSGSTDCTIKVSAYPDVWCSLEGANIASVWPYYIKLSAGLSTLLSAGDSTHAVICLVGHHQISDLATLQISALWLHAHSHTTITIMHTRLGKRRIYARYFDRVV